VYLEADHCTIKTIKEGYGTYSDSACHNVFNSCTFDVAGMCAIMADESDITFTDVNAKCGSYFALIHNVGSVTDIATLKVYSGEIATKKAAILTKSANADILIDGARIKTANGVLIHSTISKDPGAKKKPLSRPQPCWASTRGSRTWTRWAMFCTTIMRPDP